MKSHLCLLLGLAAYINSYGQYKLTGKIIDENGKAIESANVIIFIAKLDSIITYTKSDQNGKFNLVTKYQSDSLSLVVSHLEFNNLTLTLPNNIISPLSIKLTKRTTHLSEITIIEKNKIKLRKDTLSYNIDAFSDKSDHVLVDVLKKLPGIKVNETGQIFYQNKPISKFYIEGRDLLEDRYSLASNNIDLTAIEKVQILEKHQPLKILDSLEKPNSAALNVKLKKTAKHRLFGNSDIGIGVPFLTKEINLSGMKFDENKQLIAIIKNNNIGKNLEYEIKEHQEINHDDKTRLKLFSLEVPSPPSPPLEPSRYKFNENTLSTTNILYSISKDFDLKVNIGVNKDELKASTNTKISMFYPEETLIINEFENNVNDFYKFFLRLSLEKNKNNTYLKNSFNIIFNKSINKGLLESTQIITQNLTGQSINISNDFSRIFKISNILFTITSNNTLSSSPKHLFIKPEGASDYFTRDIFVGDKIESLEQNYITKLFQTDNNLSFSKRIKKFYVNNRVGISFSTEKNNNDLLTYDGLTFTSNGTNFKNTTSQDRLVSYNVTSLSYSKNKLKIFLDGDFKLKHIKNRGYALNVLTSEFLFSPSLTFNFKLNSEINSITSFSAKNYIDFYYNPSYILKNYRLLVKSDTFPRTTSSKNASSRIEYKNMISSIFMNIDIQYSSLSSNTLLENNYYGSFTYLTPLLRNNSINRLTIQPNLSKYYSNLNTLIDLSGEFELSKSIHMQNGHLIEFRNKINAITAKIISKINSKTALEYSSYFSKQFGFIFQSNDINKLPLTSLIKQRFAFKFFYNDEFLIKTVGEYYTSRSQNSNHTDNVFLDLYLQKRIKHPKAEVSLSFTNILNTNKYVSNSVLDSYIMDSEYILRPRMLLAKIAFQY